MPTSVADQSRVRPFVEHATLPQRLSAIVFDVDGMLYSQLRLRFSMAPGLAARLLVTPSRFRVIKVIRAYRQAHETVRARGLQVEGGQTQLRLTAATTGLPAGEVQTIVDEWFYSAPLNCLANCIRPSLVRLLVSARAARVRLGVCSDYPAERKLAAAGLTGMFDAVVSSFDREVNALKPDPKGLLRCLSLLGIRPEETLYLGDRPEVDRECAARAGVASLILGFGHGRMRAPRAFELLNAKMMSPD